MQVWHVMQVVSPDHNTSYRTGRNWCESHDTERKAQQRAERMNDCRCVQSVGVHYEVSGPQEETETPV